MKKLLLLLSAGILIFTGTVEAQFLTGSVTANVYSGGPFFGSDSSSSMKLGQTNIIQSATGSFATIVPQNGILLATSEQFNSLSTTPRTDPIDNYLHFSGPDPFPGMTASGTSPIYRFSFDLLTIEEDSFNSGTGAAVFTGTGTIIDSSSVFQNTLADLTVDFSNSTTYTLTITAVPEPATLSLMVMGLAGALMLRRRKA